VRAALGRLLADGLEVRTARGRRVVTLDARRSSRSTSFGRPWGLAAEQTARRQAAGMMAPAEVRRIQEAADAVEQAVADGDAKRSARANLAFHRTFGLAPATPTIRASPIGRAFPS
jgi:DNA-binding GntR family transcriptional regulator